MKKLSFLILFGFLANFGFTQSAPLIPSTKITINSVTVFTDPYTVVGTTNDVTSNWAASDISAGDSVYLEDGNELRVYYVQSITSASGTNFTIVINDMNNTGNIPPTGVGALYRGTVNYDFPNFTAGISESLQTLIQNRFVQRLDTLLKGLGADYITTDSFSTFTNGATFASIPIGKTVWRTTTGSLFEKISSTSMLRRSTDDGENARLGFTQSGNTLLFNANLYNKVRLSSGNISSATIQKPSNYLIQETGENFLIGITTGNTALTVTWDTIYGAFNGATFTQMPSTVLGQNSTVYFKFRIINPASEQTKFQYVDGTGGSTTLASNGLTMDGDTVQLGGTLNANTLLNLSNKSLSVNGTNMSDVSTPSSTAPSRYMYASKDNNFTQIQYGATASYVDNQWEANTSYGNSKIQMIGFDGDSPIIEVHVDNDAGEYNGIEIDSNGVSVKVSASTKYPLATTMPSTTAGDTSIQVVTGNPSTAVWMDIDDIGGGGGGSGTTQDTVYVLASGQSNMLGGNCAGGDTSSIDGVEVYVNGTFRRAALNMYPFDENNIAYTFAKEMASRENVLVRIVIHAIGGRAISQWVPTTQPMYDSLDIKATASGVDKFDFFLWHQGESDGAQTDAYYIAKFDTLYMQLGAETYVDSSTLFLLGGLFNNTGRTTALRTLGAYRKLNIGYVSSADLTACDGIHFTAASIQTFGERFYAAAKSLPTQAFYNQSFITGLTSGYMPKATSSSTLGDGRIYDTGTNLVVDGTTGNSKISIRQASNSSTNGIGLEFGGFWSYIFNSTFGRLTLTSADNLVLTAGSGKQVNMTGDLLSLNTSTVGATTAEIARINNTAGQIYSMKGNGNLLIGTSGTAASKLNVYGNASIGTSYVTTAAPTNGAIIEGTVGIGTSSPNSKAILDLSSTSLGFLAPRMTITQRNAITSPTMGLFVFQTTTNKPSWYNGSAWRVPVDSTTAADSFWKLTGANTFTGDMAFNGAFDWRMGNTTALDTVQIKANRIVLDAPITASSINGSDLFLTSTDTTKISGPTSFIELIAGFARLWVAGSKVQEWNQSDLSFIGKVPDNLPGAYILEGTDGNDYININSSNTATRMVLGSSEAGAAIGFQGIRYEDVQAISTTGTFTAEKSTITVNLASTGTVTANLTGWPTSASVCSVFSIINTDAVGSGVDVTVALTGATWHSGSNPVLTPGQSVNAKLIAGVLYPI